MQAKHRIVVPALIVLVATSLFAGEKETLTLWPNGAPFQLEGDYAPTVTVYPASGKNAGESAVLVCPGGGYVHLAMDHEGKQVAEWLNSIGITAFVLRYRVGDWEGRNRYPVPSLDAQRALRLVRYKADTYGYHKEKIGILGFSAGGHLASTIGTHFDSGDPYATDEVDRVSSRPNFMVLIYPVISFETKYVHRGSRRALIGDDPDLHLVQFLSNEKQVTSMTPPTFLVHTSQDRAVPAENSILFYMALKEAGVPAEMHIYERGKHGFGLAPDDPVLSTWPKHCEAWMRKMGM